MWLLSQWQRHPPRYHQIFLILYLYDIGWKVGGYRSVLFFFVFAFIVKGWIVPLWVRTWRPFDHQFSQLIHTWHDHPQHPHQCQFTIVDGELINFNIICINHGYIQIFIVIKLRWVISFSCNLCFGFFSLSFFSFSFFSFSFFSFRFFSCNIFIFYINHSWSLRMLGLFTFVLWTTPEIRTAISVSLYEIISILTKLFHFSLHLSGPW